ncbi:hypothetical protein Q5P01_000704 [Channa striata]|uniref:Uncharacterized protein n=1 Tax=Channa striata TaxID=64152 RepID=A0AA88IIF2_CHASR|nr:hypothetical protein Q5P01_000704 [Channa striata]
MSTTASTESSQEEILVTSEAALKKLTQDFLPGYTEQIHGSTLIGLEAIVSDLNADALNQSLEDKDKLKMLGRMAIVMATQLKRTHHLLEHYDRCDVRKQQLQQLQGENKLLEHHSELSKKAMADSAKEKEELEKTNHTLKQSLLHCERELAMTRNQHDKALTLLCQTTEEMEDLKTKNKILNRYLADDQQVIQQLQEQKQRVLINIRRELDYSFGKEERRHASHDSSCQEIRKEDSSSREIKKEFSPALLPHIPPESLRGQHTPRSVSPVATNAVPPAFPVHHPSQGPSDKDLDRIAHNIERFEPSPGGSYDTTGYLKDISFYLQRYPQATTTDKIYLIKITSSREVSNFIERQPRAVRDDYDDPVSQTGLDAAMNVKQGRHECPQVYYRRLLRAYFGSKNEPWMEEDLNFKTLFIKNLHPATSTHLGIAANPRNSTSQHLRELASLGFAKHQEAHRKTLMLAQC